MSQGGRTSIITDLWNRRVPQFTATYVGICWGILQFLLFASSRYNLNNSLIDKFLVFAVLLLPGVLIFIYNHGSPGKDKWKRYEKIIIPLNFIIALVFAGLFSPGNKISAAPMEVQVTDELGDTITRLVPSISQTKSFAVFPFINKGETENEWIKYATPELMTMDMEQDMRMYCLGPFSFNYLFQSNNVSLESNDIPFSKYLSIANERISDYFVIGEYEGTADNFKATAKVYDTKTGELFFDEVISATDIFGFVDEFNKKLSENLFIEDGTEKIQVTDLPAADLLSPNTEAIKSFITAFKIDALTENYFEARNAIDKAVAKDPNSAMFKTYQSIYYYSTGQLDTSKLMIQEALNLSDALPERQKFGIRQMFYIYNQQMNKNLALLDAWRKLYPKDYQPYERLIEYYSLTQNIKKAKETGLQALENGHGALVLQKLAGFEINQGNYDQAEYYLDEYYKLFPAKNKMEDTQLADIYLKKSEFKKAEQWYENILILNPNDFKIMMELSEVYDKQWKFNEAENILTEALANAKLRDDSASVYAKQIFHYYRTGEVDNFTNTINKHFNIITPKNGSPLNAAFRHLQFGGIYTVMGQEKRVREIGDTLMKYAPQMMPTYNCVADFVVALVTENKTLFESSYTGFCKSLILSGTPTMEYMADGIYAKMNGNYAEAVRLLETYIDTTGTHDNNLGLIIPECLRLDKKYDEAIAYCQKALETSPDDVYLHLELAESYLEIGKKSKAAKICQDVKTKILAKSDERFMPYKKLLEIEEKLNS